jgi:hypothetical protein
MLEALGILPCIWSLSVPPPVPQLTLPLLVVLLRQHLSRSQRGSLLLPILDSCVQQTTKESREWLALLQRNIVGKCGSLISRPHE